MSCQEFNVMLQELLEKGETKLVDNLTSHMEMCKACAAKYAKVQQLLGEIAREKAAVSPVYLQAKIMDRVLAIGKERVYIRPIHWYTAAASIAAGIMLGIIIGSTTYFANNNLTATSDLTIQQASYSTPMDDFIFTSNDQ